MAIYLNKFCGDPTEQNDWCNHLFGMFWGVECTDYNLYINVKPKYLKQFKQDPDISKTFIKFPTNQERAPIEHVYAPNRYILLELLCTDGKHTKVLLPKLLCLASDHRFERTKLDLGD